MPQTSFVYKQKDSETRRAFIDKNPLKHFISGILQVSMIIRMTVCFIVYLFFGVTYHISLKGPNFALRIASLPHSASPESWQRPGETSFVWCKDRVEEGGPCLWFM